LNLTVAHQYTAQLISDKSSAVRDAVFGNVGTMIVFRVGSDDADFLEKEFDPEFTPQDIVNLPNYKVYMKLMIDGVTSRPFSAKTLPPMVNSGDKKIEEEVIKSSRALYCKTKEVVEREINDWSGMSLGNENETTPGGLEKFPAVCSFCKKETTVPFKPEPGRAVYCKDCIARIKSGEIKVEKKGTDQIKYDETKFFKPLADLGIEFKQKNENVEVDDRYPERLDKFGLHEAEKKIPTQNIPSARPKIFSAIKKVFTPSPVNKPKPVINYKQNVPVKNFGLKEVLNKALSETPSASSGPPATPAPVSLDALKEKVKTVNQNPVQNKDRAASPEDMNKLKDLIAQKVPTPIPTPVPQKPVSVKEVPEDVLRKVLE